MATPGIRVLGIDTALRNTGVAVVEALGNQYRVLEYGVIRNSDRAPHSSCLRHLSDALDALIRRNSPQEIAIEGIFFCKNVKTAVVLGQARGAVIARCASHDLPIYEYSPRRVKMAVVGNGAADKSQVRKMAMALLGICKEPDEDSGDAMALAICHLNQRAGVSVLLRPTI